MGPAGGVPPGSSRRRPQDADARGDPGRAVNIVKMRNSDHSKEVYNVTIDTGGLVVGTAMEDVTGVLGWTALRAAATVS